VRARKNRLERESYEKRIRNLEARVAELTTNKEEVIEKTVIYRITDENGYIVKAITKDGEIIYRA
jgi:hypothetical protein